MWGGEDEGLSVFQGSLVCSKLSLLIWDKVRSKWDYLKRKEDFIRMASSISRVYKQTGFFFMKNNHIFSEYFICIFCTQWLWLTSDNIDNNKKPQPVIQLSGERRYIHVHLA